MTIIEHLNVGGMFTFPTSALVKKAKANNKRDMRKKLTTSPYPTYTNNRIINKALGGLKFASSEAIIPEGVNIEQDNKIESPILGYKGNDKLYSQLSKFKTYDEIMHEVTPSFKYESTRTPAIDYSGYVGYKTFSSAYDKVEEEMPEAKKYRHFLTKVAFQESKFKASAKNPNAPAYGYFQFMQDYNKYNNILQYSGLSIEDFKKDPIALIKAAVKLAQSFELSLTLDDLNKAKKQGFDKSSLLGGAWLAGVGGVRKYLNGEGNPSDKHWDIKEGNGTTVKDQLIKFKGLLV